MNSRSHDGNQWSKAKRVQKHSEYRPWTRATTRLERVVDLFHGDPGGGEPTAHGGIICSSMLIVTILPGRRRRGDPLVSVVR